MVTEEVAAAATAGGNGNGKNNHLSDIYISGSNKGIGFNIEIHFDGTGWTDALKMAFIEAADFLSAVISGDRPDYIAADDGNNFFNQDIDDIMISATLTEIDGIGGILAQAGPTHVIYEPANGETLSDALPFAGIMQFDSADAESYLASDRWQDIVLHEMMHTLGFGSLWEMHGLVTMVVDDNNTPETEDDIVSYDYNGDYVISFTDDPNTTEIEKPIIEADGSAGTAGSHWDEEIYDNELMTGYIDESNSISQMSIAALADLGYIIDWQSDEYIGLA